MWEIRRQDTGELLLTGDGARPGQYDLANRDLSGADLAASEARFDGGVLKGARLAGATFAGLRLPYLVAPQADLAKADLSGLRCCYVDLRGADLRGANLRFLRAGASAANEKARVWNIALSFALVVLVHAVGNRVLHEVIGTVLTLVILARLAVVLKSDVHARRQRRQRGIFDEMPDYAASPEMVGIEIGRADLSGASLVGARLPYLQAQHASFRGADLRNASLRSANLVHADLSGADIRGTDFREACMVDANLSGAVYDERTRFPADFMPDRHGTMVRAGRGDAPTR